MSGEPRLEVSAEHLDQLRKAVDGARRQVDSSRHQANEPEQEPELPPKADQPKTPTKRTGRGPLPAAIGVVLVLVAAVGVTIWRIAATGEEDQSTELTSSDAPRLSTPRTPTEDEPPSRNEPEQSTSSTSDQTSTDSPSTSQAQSVTSTTGPRTSTNPNQPLRLTATYLPVPAQGGPYSLNITVINTGPEPVSLEVDRFTLDVGFDVLEPSDLDFPTTVIVPNGQVTGEIVFDVPADLGSATLVLGSAAGPIRLLL